MKLRPNEERMPKWTTYGHVGDDVSGRCRKQPRLPSQRSKDHSRDAAIKGSKVKDKCLTLRASDRSAGAENIVPRHRTSLATKVKACGRNVAEVKVGGHAGLGKALRNRTPRPDRPRTPWNGLPTMQPTSRCDEAHRHPIFRSQFPLELNVCDGRRGRAVERQLAGDEVKGLPDVLVPSRHRPGFLQRLEEKRKARVFEFSQDFEDKLQEVSNEVGQEVANVCLSTTKKLQEDLTAMETERLLPDGNDVTASTADFEQSRKNIEVRSGTRLKWIADMTENLYKLEELRVLKIRKILMKSKEDFKAKLPAHELSDLLFWRAMAVNQSVIANRHAIASLSFQLGAVELSRQDQMTSHCKTRETQFCNTVVGQFRCDAIDVIHGKPSSPTVETKSIQGEITRLSLQRHELLSSLSHCAPPLSKMTVAPRLDKLQNLQGEISKQMDVFLCRQHASFDTFLTETFQEVKTRHQKVLDKQVPKAMADSVLESVLVLVKGMARANMEQLARVRPEFEKLSADVCSEIHSLCEYLQGLAHLWDLHRLEKREGEKKLQQQLGEKQQEFDTENKKKERSLADLLQAARQEDSAQKLNKRLTSVAKALDDLKKSYEKMYVNKLQVISTYPETMNDVVNRYFQSVCIFFNVDRVVPPDPRSVIAQDPLCERHSVDVARSSTVSSTKRKSKLGDRASRKRASKKTAMTTVWKVLEEIFTDAGTRYFALEKQEVHRKSTVGETKVAAVHFVSRASQQSRASTESNPPSLHSKTEDSPHRPSLQDAATENEPTQQDLSDGTSRLSVVEERSLSEASRTSLCSCEEAEKAPGDADQRDEDREDSEQKEEEGTNETDWGQEGGEADEGEGSCPVGAAVDEEADDVDECPRATLSDDVEETLGWMKSLVLPADFFVDVRHKIRRTFLNHLDTYRSEVIDEAEAVGQALADELASQHDVRLHLHRTRLEEVKVTVIDVRREELNTHRERLTSHLEVAKETTQGLQTLLAELKGRQQALGDAFLGRLEELHEEIHQDSLDEILGFQNKTADEVEAAMGRMHDFMETFKRETQRRLEEAREKNEAFRNVRTFAEGGNFSASECSEVKAAASKVATTLDKTGSALTDEAAMLEACLLYQLTVEASALQQVLEVSVDDCAMVATINRSLAAVAMRKKWLKTTSGVKRRCLERSQDALRHAVAVLEEADASWRAPILEQARQALFHTFADIREQALYLDCLRVNPVTPVTAVKSGKQSKGAEVKKRLPTEENSVTWTIGKLKEIREGLKKTHGTGAPSVGEDDIPDLQLGLVAVPALGTGSSVSPSNSEELASEIKGETTGSEKTKVKALVPLESVTLTERALQYLKTSTKTGLKGKTEAKSPQADQSTPIANKRLSVSNLHESYRDFSTFIGYMAHVLHWEYDVIEREIMQYYQKRGKRKPAFQHEYLPMKVEQSLETVKSKFISHLRDTYRHCREQVAILTRQVTDVEIMACKMSSALIGFFSKTHQDKLSKAKQKIEGKFTTWMEILNHKYATLFDDLKVQGTGPATSYVKSTRAEAERMTAFNHIRRAQKTEVALLLASFGPRLSETIRNCGRRFVKELWEVVDLQVALLDQMPVDDDLSPSDETDGHFSLCQAIRQLRRNDTLDVLELRERVRRERASARRGRSWSRVRLADVEPATASASMTNLHPTSSASPLSVSGNVSSNSSRKIRFSLDESDPDLLSASQTRVTGELSVPSGQANQAAESSTVAAHGPSQGTRKQEISLPSIFVTQKVSGGGFGKRKGAAKHSNREATKSDIKARAVHNVKIKKMCRGRGKKIREDTIGRVVEQQKQGRELLKKGNVTELSAHLSSHIKRMTERLCLPFPLEVVHEDVSPHTSKKMTRAHLALFEAVDAGVSAYKKTYVDARKFAEYLTVEEKVALDRYWQWWGIRSFSLWGLFKFSRF